MEAALEKGNLVEAISLLETMIISSPPGDLCSLLANQNVRNEPVLHYLVRLPFQEKDIPRLDRLIKIFTAFGYDINKKTGYWGLSLGFTALMASVSQRNLILMECLLRHGARTDIRDLRGLSPCHWVILQGDLECLEKLVQFGGPSVLATYSDEKGGNVAVLPLLHMAVDKSHRAIVSYLLSKWEEFGVDVNEKAVYHAGFGKEPNLEDTPLERAVRNMDVPIVQILLKHPGIKFPGPDELHLSLQRGFPEMALVLLDYVSDEQLASDKLTLHSLHSVAFQAEHIVEFTKKLVLEYVRRGWNLNSVPGFTKTLRMEIWRQLDVNLTRYNLLHLACLYEGEQDVIELLVEAGADINSKTEGDLELTPLHISLAMKQWATAAYLIDKGADLSVKGTFKSCIPPLGILRTLISWTVNDRNSSLNAVELLVRMGFEEGLPLLDKVLARPGVVWNGANEFHLAAEGASPVYISKVLQHCAKLISEEDLRWVKFRKTSGGKLPTLLYLLGTLKEKDGRSGDFVNVSALYELINLLVSLGYDLNLSKESSFPRALSTEGILHPILEIDFRQDSSNLLLRTVLQVDHFRLNWPKFQCNRLRGIHLLDFVVWLGSNGCRSIFPICWENKPTPPPNVEAVKLLITHGLDATGMVIGRQFSYHFGYNVILKMMYRAGAQILEDFFTSPNICSPIHPETQAFLQEIAEVKKWKDEFDRKEGCGLKHMCRLQVRKTLKCIGDLNRLDGLPDSLKKYILCQASV